MQVYIVFFDGSTELQTVNSRKDVSHLVEYYGSSVDSIVVLGTNKVLFSR
jgi:hypothetical protein